MTTRQNQILAVEVGIKTRVNEKITAAYHMLKKTDLFNGFVKKFEPLAADQTGQLTDMQPDQAKHVVADTEKLLKEISTQLTELMDITWIRDTTNCIAKADVEVDGKVLLKDAPTSYLLWLEKRLNDILTEVKNIPTLDAAERWTYDSNQGMYVTEPTKVLSTKKVVQPLVLYAATKEHPAQVKEVSSDVPVGTWSTVKQSSALPVDRKEVLVSRVEKLQRSVKKAREEANMTEVTAKADIGRAIFEFILAK